MPTRVITVGDGETLQVDARPGSSVEIAVQGVPAGDAPQVVPLSQRDPRWRNVPLGHSTHYTIGSAGCALCCATMVAGMVELGITPAELQDRLLLSNGFYGANLNWAAVPRVVPDLDFGGIINWVNGPADMGVVYEHLDDHPVILWVDFHPGGGQNTHFVMAFAGFGDDLLIADPWDGYTGNLLLRYALDDWDLARAIYGIRPLYVTPGGPVDTERVAIAVDSWPEKRE